jgi:hypothetical protein
MRAGACDTFHVRLKKSHRIEINKKKETQLIVAALK